MLVDPLPFCVVLTLSCSKDEGGGSPVAFRASLRLSIVV